MEEVLQYINEAAPDETKLFQIRFIGQVHLEHGDNLVLQLDKPLVRLQRADGVQFATLNVLTGAFEMTVVGE